MTSQPTGVQEPWGHPGAPQSEARQERRPPRARWLLGVIATLLALAAGTLQVLGIIQASNLNWERGTLLAWLAIGTSVIAFIVGLVAVIMNRGRRWGVVAMVAAVIANPWVLAQLLGALD